MRMYIKNIPLEIENQLSAYYPRAAVHDMDEA